jgi:hypothetical protein
MPKSHETDNSKRPNFRRLLAVTRSAAVIMLPALATAASASADVQPRLKPVAAKQNKQAGRDVSHLDQRLAGLSAAHRGVGSTDGSAGNKLSDLKYIVDVPAQAGKGHKQDIFEEVVPTTPDGQIVSRETQSLSIQEVEDGIGKRPTKHVKKLSFTRDPLTHRLEIGEVDISIRANGSKIIVHQAGLNNIVHEANHIVDEAAAVPSPVRRPPPSQ